MPNIINAASKLVDTEMFAAFIVFGYSDKKQKKMQKVALGAITGHLLHAKRPRIANQYVAFCCSPSTNIL